MTEHYLRNSDYCPDLCFASACFDTVLDQVQSRNVEKTEHVDHHPGDDPPANIGCQHNPCDQSIEAQPDLDPDHGANRRNIGIVNFLFFFVPVIQIQLWCANKCAAFAK